MLRFLHLYPEHMNLYGDRGNVLALAQRAKWRGIPVEIVHAGPGQAIELSMVHLVFLGGGEDVHQARIANDFYSRRQDLTVALTEGLPMLAICGGFQLLGHYYRPQAGQDLPGIGFLDVTTEAGPSRAIGDVVSDTTLDLHPGTLVGFENHSGQTYLGSGVAPLGRVRWGHGNNGRDGTEGAVRQHVIGTYLHGSLLPKNPHLTDLLLSWALERAGEVVPLPPLDDQPEWMAHQVIVARQKQPAMSGVRLT